MILYLAQIMLLHGNTEKPVTTIKLSDNCRCCQSFKPLMTSFPRNGRLVNYYFLTFGRLIIKGSQEINTRRET